VTYNGYVMPCCMTSTPDRINFGRVQDSSLAAIREGAAFTSFRDGLANGDPAPICRACAVYKGMF